MTGGKRDYGREEKALYFGTFNSIFFLLFEQDVSYFHFALGPANSVTHPDNS